MVPKYTTCTGRARHVKPQAMQCEDQGIFCKRHKRTHVCIPLTFFRQILKVKNPDAKAKTRLVHKTKQPTNTGMEYNTKAQNKTKQNKNVNKCTRFSDPTEWISGNVKTTHTPVRCPVCSTECSTHAEGVSEQHKIATDVR